MYDNGMSAWSRLGGRHRLRWFLIIFGEIIQSFNLIVARIETNSLRCTTQNTRSKRVSIVFIADRDAGGNILSVCVFT